MGPATDKHQAPTHRLKLYVRAVIESEARPTVAQRQMGQFQYAPYKLLVYFTSTYKMPPRHTSVINLDGGTRITYVYVYRAFVVLSEIHLTKVLSLLR